MAKIKEEIHTSNKLSRLPADDMPEQKDQTALLSDQTVYAENMETYSTTIKRFERSYDREQILMMSREHQRVQFRGWLLGEMLKVKKAQIEEGESDFSSWNDMFAKHKADLGFSRQAADNYLKLNANFTIEEYKRLGTRICLELTRIKDEEQREKTKKAFFKKADLTAETAKEAVEKVITHSATLARQAAEEEKDEAFGEVKYTLVKAGPTDILFRTDRKFVEAAQNVLLTEEARLKVKIYEEYKRLTGRK